MKNHLELTTGAQMHFIERLPSNVRFVRWYRQRVNWPAGHDLVAIDPTQTNIAPAEVIRSGLLRYLASE